MPLDPRAKRFLDRLAALNPPSVLALTVSERRTGLRQLLSFAGLGEAVAQVEERTLPGPSGMPLSLRIYRPVAAVVAEVPAPAVPATAAESAAPCASSTSSLAPALVYFHGGGLVAGSLDTHDPICRAWSNASGCVLLSVDYRLAPEFPFPAAIVDACHATAWIAAHAAELGIDPDKLGVCGDSAGATLAAVVCQTLTETGEVKLAMQVLLCPILDFCTQTASRRDYASGYLVDQATLDHDLQHYLGADGDPMHPRVSPARVADVRGFPPTCIHSAEFDPLRDEAAEFAARLRAAGIQTTYTCHSGMIHLFYGLGQLIPYATTAWRLIGTDIRNVLGGPQ